MECGDKSSLSKAVPRHRTPKDGVFRGLCPPLNLPMGEERGLSRREARLWGSGEGEEAQCCFMARRRY